MDQILNEILKVFSKVKCVFAKQVNTNLPHSLKTENHIYLGKLSLKRLENSTFFSLYLRKYFQYNSNSVIHNARQFRDVQKRLLSGSKPETNG